MELLGHEFFAYKNQETNEVNILYKRKDGDYGVLEIKQVLPIFFKFAINFMIFLIKYIQRRMMSKYETI